MATVDALVRCLEAAGGRCAAGSRSPGWRSGTAGSRSTPGEDRIEAGKAVVSAGDARRLLLGLLDEANVPPRLLAEARRIHVGRANVSELKVDAILTRMPEVPGTAGNRAGVSAVGTPRPTWRPHSRASGSASCRSAHPLMVAFPSTLEPGWAPTGGRRCGCRRSCRGGPRPVHGTGLPCSVRPTMSGGSPRRPWAPPWSRSTACHRPARMGRAARQPARQSQPRRYEPRPARELPAIAEPGRLSAPRSPACS